MAWRESFHVPPMIHQNPIPTAARTGNMLYTSVISGRDLETGKVPDSAAEQAVNVFKILRMILEKAGASAGDGRESDSLSEGQRLSRARQQAVGRNVPRRAQPPGAARDRRSEPGRAAADRGDRGGRGPIAIARGGLCASAAATVPKDGSGAKGSLDGGAGAKTPRCLLSPSLGGRARRSPSSRITRRRP